MEIKYTTDGKKVAVIGNLNAQEKIVQEIFIVNGQEIPSGENFVVKSLHDYPAVSWKESNLKEIESRYNKKKTEIEKSLKLLDDRYNNSKSAIEQKCQYLKKFIDNVTIESFNVLTKFLKGEIKYIVTGGYSPKILDYNIEEMDTSFGERNLKLLTLFGKSDGTLVWGINKYKDGSGYDSVWYAIATNYEDAKELFLKAVREYGKINESTIKEAKRHNIKLDSSMIDAYKQETKEGILKSIENKKKEIEKQNQYISELDNI